MKIEQLTPQNMNQTGSSLLRILQDEHTPVLDLLVRESIQNSLDAGKDDSRYVKVGFTTGSFKSTRLSKELDGITDMLNERYPEGENSYIAIRDYMTYGLTGELSIDDVRDHNYGNLVKLVYSIGKPQEQAGAGGSWGYGKTVYYRIGMGLVLYYSRIWDEKKSNYQSRLAACLVEDETSPEHLLPGYNGMQSMGIAWWGNAIRENKTIPLTDEEQIEKILDIFGIEPYIEKETGTTVIVPYTDNIKLLKNNARTYLNGQSQISPYWMNNIAEYLKISVQRWYFARLNNSYYPYGKFLQCFINRVPISKDAMAPVFLLEQALYNRAVSRFEFAGEDIITEEKVDVHTESIKITRLLNDTNAGKVSFAKVKGHVLHVCPPDNLLPPEIYLNCRYTGGQSIPPVLAFCRKPGMAVSYVQSGDWLTSVPTTEINEYIIAVFVLNSENSFKNTGESLEEYVRNSEMANHSDWQDHGARSEHKDIIQKIKNSVAKKIATEFEQEDEDTKTTHQSGLGLEIAKLILPPVGFGMRPTGRKTKGDRKSEFKSQKTFKFRMLNEETKYEGSYVDITYEVVTKSPTDKFSIEMNISAEGKPISPSEWENSLGLEMPFAIDHVRIFFKKIDIGKHRNYEIDAKKLNDEDSLMKLNMQTTASHCGTGIMIQFSEKHHFDMFIQFRLRLTNKESMPVFIPKQEN